jgi:AraC-like DNA-binding protein
MIKVQKNDTILTISGLSMCDASRLELAFFPSVKALNAGLFISRGKSIHPDRIIDSFQIIFVVDGELAIREGNTDFFLKAGQSIILYPRIRHAGIKSYGAGLSFYWVHFTRRRMKKETNKIVLSVPKVAAIQQPERLIEIFRRFLNDQEAGGLSARRGAILIMNMLIEIAESEETQKNIDIKKKALAERAFNFIRIHFHEDINTTRISSELKCNPDYLSRVFRGSYKKSLTTYIHERRMHYARNLLMNSDYTIREIGFECGFRYSNYFNRIFKRYEGMTPKAFRRLYERVHTVAEQ